MTIFICSIVVISVVLAYLTGLRSARLHVDTLYYNISHDPALSEPNREMTLATIRRNDPSNAKYRFNSLSSIPTEER